jgi:5'-methylthioadenosine/S-adenosylhomocysteine nucleosidase
MAEKRIKYKKIALLMAMKGEAMPLIKHYSLKQIAFHNPIIVYANADESLILLLNGFDKEHQVDNIGTQAATLNAFVAISEYNPDLIINCGTAGGFYSQGGAIADVYIADQKVCFHDRRIALPGGFPAYAQGDYPVLKSGILANKFGLKQGVISSSDALDYTKTDMKIMQQNNTAVKEMEAAAIAWVCHINKQKFTAIKSITDIVDGQHTTGDEFLANFKKATDALKEKVVLVVDYLLDI